MKVYVVMSNDFPDKVFADKAKADAYVAEKMAEQIDSTDRFTRARIYYRTYDFEVVE